MGTPVNQARDLYSRKARFYQKFFVDFLKWDETLRLFFRHNANLQSSMKILDAGCGTGSVTRALLDLAGRENLTGMTFHGFDLTPGMLELFQDWIDRQGVTNVHLHQADVLDLDRQLPEDWTGYDLVVSATLLEYIPGRQLTQALSNLRSRLRPQGRLLLLVTRKTWIAQLIGGAVWKTNTFRAGAVENLLLQAGFQTRAWRDMPHPWNAFILAVEAV